MRRAFLTTTVVLAAIAFSANGFASGSAQPSGAALPASCNNVISGAVANPTAPPQAPAATAPGIAGAKAPAPVPPATQAGVQRQPTVAPSAIPPAQKTDQRPVQQPMPAPAAAEKKPVPVQPTNIPTQTSPVPQAACPPAPSQGVSAPAASRPVVQGKAQPVNQDGAHMRMAPAPAAGQSSPNLNVQGAPPRPSADQSGNATSLLKSRPPAAPPAVSGALVKEKPAPVAPQRTSQGTAGQTATPKMGASGLTQPGQQCVRQDAPAPAPVENASGDPSATSRGAAKKAAPAPSATQAPAVAATGAVPVDRAISPQCPNCPNKRPVAQPPATGSDRKQAPVTPTAAPQQAQPERPQLATSIAASKPQTVQPAPSADMRPQAVKQDQQAAGMHQPQTAAPAVNTRPAPSNQPASPPVAGAPANPPAQTPAAGMNVKPAAPAPANAGVTNAGQQSCGPAPNPESPNSKSAGAQGGTWQQAPAGSGPSGTAVSASGNVKKDQPINRQPVNPPRP